MLRSRWRGLETESRLGLHGHDGEAWDRGKGITSRTTVPALDATGLSNGTSCSSCQE